MVSQDDEKNRSLILDSNSIVSIESSVRTLDRLTKTFHEICSGLTTQVLLLSGKFSLKDKSNIRSYPSYLDANERVNLQDIENIAFQVCDKIYRREDCGPYENIR